MGLWRETWSLYPQWGRSEAQVGKTQPETGMGLQPEYTEGRQSVAGMDLKPGSVGQALILRSQRLAWSLGLCKGDLRVSLSRYMTSKSVYWGGSALSGPPKPRVTEKGLKFETSLVVRQVYSLVPEELV